MRFAFQFYYLSREHTHTRGIYRGALIELMLMITLSGDCNHHRLPLPYQSPFDQTDYLPNKTRISVGHLINRQRVLS